MPTSEMDNSRPAERAVFVLREVFDMPYDEIAEVVDKSPAAVRQIAHRAKDHVSARRPRVRVVRSEHAEVVDRLVVALNTGDLQGLMDVLAPNVVSVTDGGGKVRGAARRPIVGAERLARYLVGGLAKVDGVPCVSATWVNGQRGIRMELDGRSQGPGTRYGSKPITSTRGVSAGVSTLEGYVADAVIGRIACAW